MTYHWHSECSERVLGSNLYWKTFAGNESICCSEVLFRNRKIEKEKRLKFDSVGQCKSNITPNTKVIVFRIILMRWVCNKSSFSSSSINYVNWGTLGNHTATCWFLTSLSVSVGLFQWKTIFILALRLLKAFNQQKQINK